MTRRYPRLAAALLTALALGGAAACSSGSGAPTAAASAPRTASGAGSAPAPSATTASPSPTGMGSAPATPSTAAPVTVAPSASCLSGAVRVLYPGADNPLRTVCVHVGTQITITLDAVASYKWAPVTSSVPAVVLMLGNHAADGGTLVEVARAQAPGAATLTSADTFTPGPHGPPSRTWQLTVTVVP